LIKSVAEASETQAGKHRRQKRQRQKSRRRLSSSGRGHNYWYGSYKLTKQSSPKIGYGGI